MEGWHEVGSNKCDYRRELDRCTIRIARASPSSEEWLLEIIVGFLMVGAMRKMTTGDTIESVMEKAEIFAVEQFSKLKGFYIRLLRELD